MKMKNKIEPDEIMSRLAKWNKPPHFHCGYYRFKSDTGY